MDIFDPPLGPDPQIALIPPVVVPLVEGPAYRAQYVIELVGPRSVPASAASQLLSDLWYNALGRPEIFCMAPQDLTWQRMTGATAGSYDSVALSWDIVSRQGLITAQAAQHLFDQAERFANAVGRRALPLPIPTDIVTTGKDLVKIQERLDVGVSVAVMSKSGSVYEKDIWRICSRLGLEFSPAGSFDWRVINFPYPLLSVTPIGATEAFSLRSVQAGAFHDGVTVGFNVPRNPAPLASLDGTFQTAHQIANAIAGLILDDESRPLTAPLADEMRRSLQIAVEAFDQIGIKPGSMAAIRLFA